MVRVLLVEDDLAIRTAVLRELAAAGHDVAHATTGMEALRLAVEDPPDVVVLDLGLPDVDGERILAMLRGVSEVPVVVATARGDDRTIVRLLDGGADDFVVKPYSVAQLDARLRAVLRRAQEPGDRRVEVGDLVMDLRGHRATLDGAPLDLTRLEFAVLAHLAGRAGEVVSKAELLAEVWHQPRGGSDRTVDVHLSWLRRKLGETAAAPRYLHTVRGVGVRLEAPAP